MIINIKSYPLQAQSLFDQEKTGEIHSVFDNTVNLRVENHLFAFASREFVHTPMSIQLDVSIKEFQKMTFTVEDKVYFNQEGFVVNGYFLSIKHATIHNDVVQPFSYDEKTDSLFQLKNEIFELLLSASAQGEMVNAIKKMHGFSHEDLSMFGNYFFDQFQHIAHATTKDTKLKLIVQLLGAGEGLTPSGDDFITGVLASLHYLASYQSNDLILNDLIDRVKSKVASTTVISQEYLRFATTGRFNEYVHTMFEHHQNNQPTNDFLQKISTIGHSSGSDFLVGMYFGLEIGGI